MLGKAGSHSLGLRGAEVVKAVPGARANPQLKVSF